MANAAPDEALVRLTDASFARPLPRELLAARSRVLEAARALLAIPDTALTRSWAWKGGSEEELRYGFYRIGEAFERATIYARASMSDCVERDRAGDLIAPATAARWDLQGLLLGVPDRFWDASPDDGEWTIRRTLGHVISSQRSYGLSTAWWQGKAYHPDDEDLPPHAPEEFWADLPEEDEEATGSTEDVRRRLDDILDQSTERLAGLPDDRLGRGARWSGFAVDIAFRLGRWSSHLREHTIQVEKTLATLDYHPRETDRLVRLVLGNWGTAEAALYGGAGACEGLAILSEAADEAIATARELTALAGS